jgi:GT2 family glycosyltransferase
MESNKSVAIAAPILIDSKGKTIQQITSKELTPFRYIFTYTFIAKLFPNNKVKTDILKRNSKTTKPYQVELVPGSALIIRKNVFDSLGGFDKNFFLYFEENDLCKRAINAGYKIYKVPDTKVFHDWKPAEGNKKLKKVFEESRFYFFKKHFGEVPAYIVELFSRKWWRFE